MPELTRNEIVDHIKLGLGWPIVKVELDDVHYDHAIEEAVRFFNRYIGETQIIAFYQCDDSWTHTFTEADEIKGISNIKCLFPSTLADYAQLNIFEILYRMLYPRLPIGEWYMLKGFYKTYQRVRGVDPDWHYDSFNRKLYVDCHGGPWDIMVEANKDLSLATINVGLRSYQSMFLDVCAAQAKQVLAKVRGKFGGSIPAPGGSLQTDADQLYAEAQATLEQANKILDAEARFAAPVIIGA